MNKTENKLLDSAINLAVEKEFEQYVELDVPEIEIPIELNKRVKKTIRRRNFRQFCMDNIRVIVAACFCLFVVGIGVGVPLYASATEKDYYMLTDQNIYRNNISVQFVCKDGKISDAKTLTPKSAADVLVGFELVRTYSTNLVYIEEYDGLRYEQTALYAEGQYIIPTKNKNVRNIVINDYTAVLIFDAFEAAIVWRDADYSYMLEGMISSDDAMRYARMIGGE